MILVRRQCDLLKLALAFCVFMCSAALRAAPPLPSTTGTELPQDAAASGGIEARQRWFRHGRTAAHANTAGLLQKALEQKAALRADRLRHGLPAVVSPRAAQPFFNAGISDWVSLGPAPLISDPGILRQDFGLVSGRISALAVDPNDATGNTVYAGAAQGGLWKSTNAAVASTAAVVWTPLLDGQPSLAVGAISVKPDDRNIVLVGTGEPNDSFDSYYGLGLLRSTDGGANWTQITQDVAGNSFLGLGFAKIAFSTANPNLVVAALSSATNAQVAGLGRLSVRGLYFSTDAGATWTLATVQDGSTVLDATTASDVVFNAVSGSFFAALRNHGFYSSSDGKTFTRLAVQPDNAVLGTAACPSTTSASCPMYRGALTVTPGRNELYTWFIDSARNEVNQGIYRSNDGGASWTALDPSGIDSCGDFDGNGQPDGCSTSAGSYNLYLSAIPNGATGTDVYAGSVNLYKCTVNNAAATDTANLCTSTPGITSTAGFINLTHVFGCGPDAKATTAHMHPSQHAAGFALKAGSDAILYFGNDGGVYRALSGLALNKGGVSTVCDNTLSGTNPIDSLNGTLGSVSELSGFAQDASDSTGFMTGLQGNGTGVVAQAYNQNPRFGTGPLSATTWTEIALPGADGGPVEIDPVNSNNWYQSFPFAQLNLCSVGDSPVLGCIEGSLNPVTSGTAPWFGELTQHFTPFVLDPQLSSNLLLGTCRVYRGAGNGGPFTAISPEFGGFTTGVCNVSGLNLVTSLDAGGFTTVNGSQTIFVGTTGAADMTVPSGRVFVSASSDSGSGAWIDVTGTINPGNFDVGSVLVDRVNDASGRTAYASIMGFLGHTGGHIWKTVDLGSTWTDITGNLMDVPVVSLALDPIDGSTLYAGTDVGVFVSQNGGTSWAQYATSLPNVPVTQLRTFNHGAVAELRASTYGRGLWSIPLIGVPKAGVTLSVPNPASLTLLRGGIGTAVITLTAVNGFTGAATLSCGSLPAGTTCAFAPATLTPGTSGTTSTLTVTTSAGTPLGTSHLSVAAAPSTPGAFVTQTQGLALTATATDFSFGTTSAATVSASGSTTIKFNLTSFLGFSGAITLSCPGAPMGITCGFTPNPATPPLNGTVAVTLTISAASTVAAGTTMFPLPIQGTSNGLTHSTSVAVTVNGPDYALSSAPQGSTTIVAGGSVSYVITQISANGFSGTVTLKCGALPALTTCTSTPIAAGQTTSTLKITTTAPIVASLKPTRSISVFAALWLPLLGISLFALRFGTRRWLQAGLLAGGLTLCMILAACGGGSSSGGGGGGSPGTPAGQYNVVVTGTSGTLSHSTTVTFTVQ